MIGVLATRDGASYKGIYRMNSQSTNLEVFWQYSANLVQTKYQQTKIERFRC